MMAPIASAALPNPQTIAPGTTLAAIATATTNFLAALACAADTDAAPPSAPMPARASGLPGPTTAQATGLLPPNTAGKTAPRPAGRKGAGKQAAEPPKKTDKPAPHDGTAPPPASAGVLPQALLLQACGAPATPPPPVATDPAPAAEPDGRGKGADAADTIVAALPGGSTPQSSELLQLQGSLATPQPAPDDRASPPAPISGNAPTDADAPALGPMLVSPADAGPISPQSAATAPTHSAHVPPPSAPEIAVQIVRPLAAAAISGPGAGHTVIVRLDPPELGRLEIRLEPAGNVAVSAERPATLALLQHDQAALHHALDQAGVPSEGRTLTLNLGGAFADGRGAQNQQAPHAHRQAASGTTNASSEEDGAGPRLPALAAISVSYVNSIGLDITA